LGAYGTFVPMHLTGLAGEPRHYAQLTGIPNAAGVMLARLVPLNRFITYSALFLASAQLIFLWNLVRSLRRGAPAPSNPWLATTLEWHPALNPLRPPAASDEQLIVHRSPCQYDFTPTGELFLPQWAPDTVADTTDEAAFDTKPE